MNIIIVSDSAKRRERLSLVAQQAFPNYRGLKVLMAEPLMRIDGYLAAGIMELPTQRSVMVLDAAHLWQEDWFKVVQELQQNNFDVPVLVLATNHNNERVLQERITILHDLFEDAFKSSLQNLIQIM